MRITLIRHAETLANAAHIWQGQTDAKLSENGEAQRRRLEERMRTAHFDRVICSDLGRTCTTATALTQKAEPNPQWREANVGAWEGKTQKEIAVLFPDEVQKLVAGEEEVRLGGHGESLGEFQARVAAAFDTLVSELKTASAHAAVVTHGGVISTLLLHLMGKKKRLGNRALGRLMNTALTTIDIDAAGKAHIAIFNDATHLGPTNGTQPHSRVAVLHCASNSAELSLTEPSALFTHFDSARDILPTHPTSIASLANTLLRCQTEHARFAEPAFDTVSHFELTDGLVVMLDHAVVPLESASHANT